MEDKETLDITISDEVGRFAESYASFNKVITGLQNQYLSLKETYTRQSEELQAINRSLQSLVVENRAVTEFLNSILNSLTSGVMSVNKAGMVTHLNPAAREILHIPEEKQCRLGITYDEIMQETGSKEISAVTTVRTGRVFDRCEKKVVTCSGEHLTLSASTSILRTAEGRIVGAVELFQDITGIKHMEEQLSRMKILASLGEMAASIAHEIRNPLVAISGFATFLARDCAGDQPKAEMAQKIVDGVNSINRTIQTLLDFARHETLHKTRINFNSYLDLLCRSFVSEYDLDNADEIIIREFSETDIIEIEIDRQLMRQAVFNIIANALEACGGEPKIVLATALLNPEEVDEETRNRLDLVGNEAVLVFEIEDNGRGISSEDIGRIFSPFYSTKDNGHGLGLAIAWKIIKAHGGDIKVTSTINQGTKFNIVLPAFTSISRGKNS